MCEIYEHRRVERRLARLPLDILKRYEKWKDVVGVSGPAGLRAIKGFHDEALRGRVEGPPFFQTRSAVPPDLPGRRPAV